MILLRANANGYKKFQSDGGVVYAYKKRKNTPINIKVRESPIKSSVLSYKDKRENLVQKCEPLKIKDQYIDSLDID